MSYSDGDWIKYRHHEGWVANGKIEERRPDGYCIVSCDGQGNDTNLVDPDDIIGEL